jgi:hypothetical protein
MLKKEACSEGICTIGLLAFLEGFHKTLEWLIVIVIHCEPSVDDCRHLVIILEVVGDVVQVEVK